MQMSTDSFDRYDEEIDLRELIRTLWNGKWMIAGITGVFAVLSVIVALMLPNQYKSTAVIAPAQKGNSTMLGALASQFGGLASLAGINIGDGKSDESQIAMEIMKSWGFIDRFIKNKGIEVELFAANEWNPDTNSLEIDDDLYDVDNKKWVREPPSGKSVIPTSWELYEEFSQRLGISQEKGTGLVTVSIEFYSPILAKEWLDAYIDFINTYMRDRKLEQVNRNIEYLQSQIEKTSIAEMKEVFYQIIVEQTKSKMLAEASPEYAFVTVSEAMLAEEKSAPRRAIICILGTILGAVVSVSFLLIRSHI